MGRTIRDENKRTGGEVVTVTSAEEAIALLKDKKFAVDEVITGSLGDEDDVMDNPWAEVRDAALTERRMGVTLVTGRPINPALRLQLEKENQRFIEKRNFDSTLFIAERFLEGGPKEM